MKKITLFLCIAVMSCLLIAPVWADNSNPDDLQALKEQLMELNKVLQSQQKQIQDQDKKLLEQEYKILDLEDMATEPTPYAEGEWDLNEVVEKVKAEIGPAQDGFTIGGGKIRITPYGFIRLDMAYDDSANFLFSGNVVGWAWPEGGGSQYPNDDESFSVTATATRIGLNFDGPEFADGKIKAKLEVDFDELSGYGGDVVAHRIRMRHAYAELVYPTWSLLAGQTWDIIAPRIPYMLDCVVLWGTGNVGYRRPQLRYTKWCDLDGAKVTTQLSINHQDRSLGDNHDADNNLLDGVESGWPLGEARVGLDTTLGDHKISLGISGMLGEEEIDRPIPTPAVPTPPPTTKDNLDVWLVALDGSVWVIPGLLMVQGEIWTAKNADNVYAGIVQGVVPENGQWEEVRATGGFVHAMLTPRKDLKFNLGYGVDDVDSRDLGTGGRSLNWAVFGNVIYTLVPNFDIGLELAWHETKWVGMNDGDLFRVQTAFTYKF